MVIKTKKEQICLFINNKILEKARIKAVKQKTKISYFVEKKLKEWVK